MRPPIRKGQRINLSYTTSQREARAQHAPQHSAGGSTRVVFTKRFHAFLAGYAFSVQSCACGCTTLSAPPGDRALLVSWGPIPLTTGAGPRRGGAAASGHRWAPGAERARAVPAGAEGSRLPRALTHVTERNGCMDA